MDENPYQVRHSERPLAGQEDSSVWARIRFTLKHALGGALVLMVLATGGNYAVGEANRAPLPLMYRVLANTALFGLVFGGFGGWIVGSFRWETRMRRAKKLVSHSTD